MEIGNIKLIYQDITHAPELFRILSNPSFKFFSAKPKSLEEEIAFIGQTETKKIENKEHNFTIFVDNEIVGAFGIKLDSAREHVGRIGGYVDEKYWGKGIANYATKYCLDFMKKELRLHLCEVNAHPDNVGSQTLMKKNGFIKVGTYRDYYLIEGKFQDRDIFYKIL